MELGSELALEVQNQAGVCLVGEFQGEKGLGLVFCFECA